MFQKTTAFRIFFWASLILIGFFIFFPLLWLINTALKPTSETFSSYFFVGPLTLDNIIHIVTDPKIMGYLKNSLIVSFGSSLMATMIGLGLLVACARDEPDAKAWLARRSRARKPKRRVSAVLPGRH